MPSSLSPKQAVLKLRPWRPPLFAAPHRQINLPFLGGRKIDLPRVQDGRRGGRRSTDPPHAAAVVLGKVRRGKGKGGVYVPRNWEMTSAFCRGAKQAHLEDETTPERGACVLPLLYAFSVSLSHRMG